MLRNRSWRWPGVGVEELHLEPEPLVFTIFSPCSRLYFHILPPDDGEAEGENTRVRFMARSLLLLVQEEVIFFFITRAAGVYPAATGCRTYPGHY